MQLNQYFVNQAITNNKTFSIVYNNFLQKLIAQKQINAEFKNVQKKTFEKLEQFFIDQITQHHQLLTMDHKYKQLSKNIKDQMDRRIHQLKEQLIQEREANWMPN